MSCLGLAAQDQAATSPDKVGSLLLPPANVSCKRLPTPPVPERRCKEKVLQREGLATGWSVGSQRVPVSRMPPCTQGLAGAGEHWGSPSFPRDPRERLPHTAPWQGCASRQPCAGKSRV